MKIKIHCTFLIILFNYLPTIGMEDNKIIIKTEKSDDEQHVHTLNDEIFIESSLLPELSASQSMIDVSHDALVKNRKKHICDFSEDGQVCNKAFAQSSSLTVHKRTHTMEDNKIIIKTEKSDDEQHVHTLNYEIFIEGSLLPELSANQNMIDVSHDAIVKNRKKQHICDFCENGQVCNKAFTTPSSLTVHKRTHTGEKPYICDAFEDGHACNKAFAQSGNLTIHKQIHTGEKPYICDAFEDGQVCTKTFAALTNLISHQRIHTEGKVYICDFSKDGQVCSKAFYDRSRLNRHKLIHTGKKPYKCTYVTSNKICNKAFYQRGNLARHLQSHDKQK